MALFIAIGIAVTGYFLLAGQPVRAFEFALGTLIYLAIRGTLKKLFKIDE